MDIEEEKGSIVLGKDSDGYGYVSSKDTENFVAITDELGDPIGDDTYQDWSLIAADKFKDVNSTVWRYIDGDYWIHKHDTNWGIAFGGYADEQGTETFYELETAFDQDLNDDGDIGEPSINSGQSIFSIKGTAEVGNTLSISEDAADPDGVGTLSYSWETSSDGNTWNEVSTAATYLVETTEEGKSIRAKISYRDGEGFDEVVTTTSLSIAIPLSQLLDIEEEKGSIVLGKDSDGYGYVSSKDTENFVAITDELGDPIGDDTYQDWSLIAADKFKDVNSTVWRYIDGNYWIHKHDTNWGIAFGGYADEQGTETFYI